MEALIGIIGIGRIGRVLADRLAATQPLLLYDRNAERVAAAAQETGAAVADSMEQAAACKVVILAIPDTEVINCIKDFNGMTHEITVINVATNVSQSVLDSIAAKHVRCIGVKIIGHAAEMALGQDPVIIVNERPKELVETASQIFAAAGHVVIGRADIVAEVNTIAAEKALEAAVLIEDALRRKGYAGQDIMQSAIRQVAAGVLKAYANDDLGPFAREIVRAVKAKLHRNPR